ncbi:hypothetical protein [Paraburkholderia sp.]|uniref:hypothetical protein n=1 Tax=Paraburkholderia sp. TaxID=1926495 RepID=UPI002F400A41
MQIDPVLAARAMAGGGATVAWSTTKVRAPAGAFACARHALIVRRCEPASACSQAPPPPRGEGPAC